MNFARRAGLGVIGTLILGVGVVLPASAQQPRSYPMICRGGDNYTIALSTDNPSTNARFYFQFTRASHAATAGLKPGECAWTDRGVNANEPDSLAFEFDGAVLVVNVRVTNGATNAIFQYGGSSAQLQRIMRAIQSGDEFQVYAYNDNAATSWSRSSLKVTRVGP